MRLRGFLVRGLLLALALTACAADPVAPTGSTVTKVATGGSPCGVTEAAGSVWVTDASDGRLLRIDPATRDVTVVTTLDRAPCALVFAFDALWVTTQSGLLDRVDPATGTVTARVRVGAATATTAEVAATEDGLWVSDREAQQLTRIDPVTLATSVLRVPGHRPRGMVFAFGSLWVGDDTAGSAQVLRVDPVARSLTRVQVGHRPAYVAATATHLWVSETEEGTVSRLDPTTLVRETVTAGVTPAGLDVLGEDVWVPDTDGEAVYRFDGATVRELERLDAPGPTDVAPVGGQVWVTMGTAGEVWAITPR